MQDADRHGGAGKFIVPVIRPGKRSPDRSCMGHKSGYVPGSRFLVVLFLHSGGSRDVCVRLPSLSDFCAVAGAPLTYRYGTFVGMCFDYENFPGEIREIIKEEWNIRVQIGIFSQEQKCSLRWCPPMIQNGFGIPHGPSFRLHSLPNN